MKSQTIYLVGGSVAFFLLIFRDLGFSQSIGHDLGLGIIESLFPVTEQAAMGDFSSTVSSPIALSSNSSDPKMTLFTFDSLVRSPNTIVTAYFKLDSKHSADHYNEWTTNMLSLNDAMVIFTSPEFVDRMKEGRRHAWNRTVVITMEKLEDLPIVSFRSKKRPSLQFDQQYWINQLKIDVQRKLHKSYQLFWIWLSKSWFVTRSVEQNFFQSQRFVWSDIGCFRDTRYNHRTMMIHTDLMPKDAILHMATRTPKPPRKTFFDTKFKEKEHFFHSGSIMAGYGVTWVRFHELFMDTVDGYATKKRKLSDDQVVLQSTCMRFPICGYIACDQLHRHDDRYFGIRYVLHSGGNYSVWWPPVWNRTNAMVNSTSKRPCP